MFFWIPLGSIYINTILAGTSRLELEFPVLRTTIIFITLTICGLEYIFAIAIALGSWSSILYRLLSDSLGIACYPLLDRRVSYEAYSPMI